MKKKKCFKCGYWNAAEAAFCNLCYEPFKNKQAAGKPAPVALPPQLPAHTAPAVPLPPLLKAAFLLLGLAALGFLLPSLPPLHPGAHRAAPENRYKDKTGAADILLKDYIQAKEALLAEISAGPLDPEGFGIAGDYTVKLFDIEEKYAEGIEALELPGPDAVHKEADAFYLEWLEIHRYKESAAIMDFSRRYQVLIEKAGAGA